MKNESDEEREQRKARKAASRKVKSEAPSGDEGGLSTPGAGGGGGGGGGEPKKKRRKLKKGSGAPSAEASAQVSDAEDGGALFSGAEDEKPTKKVPSLSFHFTVYHFILAYGTYVWRTLLHQSAWGDEETRYARRGGRAHGGRTAQKAIVSVFLSSVVALNSLF